MSLYTDNVKRILYTTKAPHHGLLIDVVEFETYITLRIYRDNFEMFSEAQKLDFAEYLHRVLQQITDTSIPCYLEVHEYAPRR